MKDKKKMYRLTAAVKRKFPDLQKKRNEHFFTGKIDVAIQAMNLTQFKKLQSDYGFTIQTSLI